MPVRHFWRGSPEPHFHASAAEARACFLGNPEASGRAWFYGRRWRDHGLTLEAGIWLLEAQGGRCPVQGRGCSGALTLETAVVEHDHACCPGRKSCGACIRGLTCSTCNIHVWVLESGQRTKSPVTVAAVAVYLARGHVVFPAELTGRPPG